MPFPCFSKQSDDPDIAVRGGALRLAGLLPGEEATKKWIKKYSKVKEEVKPEILFMLGERGDELAVPLVLKALDDPSQEIANEAVSCSGKAAGCQSR